MRTCFKELIINKKYTLCTAWWSYSEYIIRIIDCRGYKGNSLVLKQELAGNKYIADLFTKFQKIPALLCPFYCLKVYTHIYTETCSEGPLRVTDLKTSLGRCNSSEGWKVLSRVLKLSGVELEVISWLAVHCFCTWLWLCCLIQYFWSGSIRRPLCSEISKMLLGFNLLQTSSCFLDVAFECNAESWGGNGFTAV